MQVETAIEGKMTNGQPLDSAEKSFYDESSDLTEEQRATAKALRQRSLANTSTVATTRAIIPRHYQPPRVSSDLHASMSHA